VQAGAISGIDRAKIEPELRVGCATGVMSQTRGTPRGSTVDRGPRRRVGGHRFGKGHHRQTVVRRTRRSAGDHWLPRRSNGRASGCRGHAVGAPERHVRVIVGHKHVGRQRGDDDWAMGGRASIQSVTRQPRSRRKCALPWLRSTRATMRLAAVSSPPRYRSQNAEVRRRTKRSNSSGASSNGGP
jgi:hypothetical protein